MQIITPQAAQKRLQESGARLIDVRTPAEFQEVHAEQACNVPLGSDEFSALCKAASQDDTTVLLICKSGSRSAQACKQLQQAGMADPISVDGGTQAWDAAGLPVLRGKKVMSLERQVRIAAGSLVLLGVLLSVFVSPWFVWLSGFIGAGLVFAGVTDTCGMGMMLAKMPWNQVKPASSAETCAV
ncbi:MAG TPA: sulfurtransferase [Planctomycetaceae bacterium]|nr:sulfurtransferase [Planctomycetaceae bacterium]